MKRAYSSPDILFESFSLNENIASANTNCTRNLANAYSNSCGVEYGGKIVFTPTAQGCIFKVPDGSAMFDGLCYHVPSNDNRLFNS